MLILLFNTCDEMKGMIDMPIGMNPGGQYYYRHTNKTKRTRGNLSIRFNVEERKILDARASACGMATSSYCHDFLLKPDTLITWPKREIASALCQHNRLVDQYVRNEEAKKELKMWEETIWRLIK